MLLFVGARARVCVGVGGGGVPGERNCVVSLIVFVEWIYRNVKGV